MPTRRFGTSSRILAPRVLPRCSRFRSWLRRRRPRRLPHPRPRPDPEAQGAAAPAGRAAGAGRGAANEPDFSPKPPVLPLTPAEEQARSSGCRRASRWSRCSPIRTSRSRRRLPSTATAACSSSSFAATCRTPTAAARSIRSAASPCHEDRNNDGVYETHGVFVDNMVFPRFVMPFGPNAILTQGIERRRGLEVHRHERRRRGRQEGAVRHRHGPAGERRAPGRPASSGRMDNWIYSTYNSVRLRWTPTGVLREPTGSNGGAVGRHAGQLRQAVVPGGRERHARLLPDSRSPTATSPIRSSSSRT